MPSTTTAEHGGGSVAERLEQMWLPRDLGWVPRYVADWLPTASINAQARVMLEHCGKDVLMQRLVSVQQQLYPRPHEHLPLAELAEIAVAQLEAERAQGRHVLDRAAVVVLAAVAAVGASDDQRRVAALVRAQTRFMPPPAVDPPPPTPPPALVAAPRLAPSASTAAVQHSDSMATSEGTSPSLRALLESERSCGRCGFPRLPEDDASTRCRNTACGMTARWDEGLRTERAEAGTQCEGGMEDDEDEEEDGEAAEGRAGEEEEARDVVMDEAGSSLLLPRDVPLAGMWYPSGGALVVFPQGCWQSRVELALVPTDLAVWRGDLVHAGPAGARVEDGDADMVVGLRRSNAPSAPAPPAPPAPRFHFVVASPAVPMPLGNPQSTDKCTARAGGPRGFVASKPLVGRMDVLATPETLLTVLDTYGVAVLPGQCELLADRVVQSVQSISAVTPMRPLEGWAPIFNGGSCVRRQQHTGAWAAAFGDAVARMLRACGALACDEHGPCHGKMKDVRDVYALRCMPGAREQPPHADVARQMCYAT